MLRSDIRLITEGELSYNAPPRSFPLWKRQLVKDFVDEGLRNQWIEPSNSRVSLELTFAFKAGKKPRPCIDCRPFNEKQIPLVYSPETGIGLRTWIQSRKYFTEYDAVKAFYRMHIVPEDRWKLAFRTPFGKYQPIGMPFGVSSAPAEYQMWLESILHGIVGLYCHIHIDNILICTNDDAKHKEVERQVENRLNQAGIVYKQTQRMNTSVQFLGILYGPTGTKPTMPESMIRDWPIPKSRLELQRFLGVIAWNSDWIPTISHETALLYEATQWNKDTEALFEKAKRKAASAIEQAAHDPWDYATIFTDSSEYGKCAILTQHGRITCTHSNKFTKAQMHYSTPDKEMMAITEALTRWYDILRPSKGITIYTDNIINITAKTMESPRKARAVEIMSQFRIRLKHISTKLNPADGPSRRPDYIDT
jgi:hypothetical protein